MAAHKTSYPHKPTGIAGKLQRLCEIQFGKVGSLPSVRKGSPEWWAWRGWYDKHNLCQSGFMETMESWVVPTEMPPESLAALDAAVGGGGDDEKW